MLHFESDYTEGAHPLVLRRLVETNLERSAGYGADPGSERARELIRTACGAPDAAVFFTVGGTQTNAVATDFLLRPWQGVLAAGTGHIAVHEAGAIEASGHKVLTLPHSGGKVGAGSVEAWLDTFYRDANFEHMVAPGMLYISHPTEYGTLYTRAELAALHGLCRRHDMLLYLDGARLAYALGSPQNDIELSDIAALCDAFYIGGTKCGALFGEALVIPDPERARHLFPVAKRHGAVLAKGRLLGLQFEALFSDGLYRRIGARTVALAARLREALVARGYRLVVDSPTNQLFVEVADDRFDDFAARTGCAFWDRGPEGRTIARFALGWATDERDVEELVRIL